MNILSICDGVNISGLLEKDFKLNHSFCIEKNKEVKKLLSPGTVLIDDISKWQESPEFLKSQIDLIFFRSPKMKCTIQGESEHDNLYTSEFCKILDSKRPRWFIWETKPRIILGDHGRQFKRIIGEIASIGYGISWRVLGSQFFNSPIKSENMYLVGHFGSWEESREILFEDGTLGEFEIESQKRKKSKLSDISEGFRELSFPEYERAFNLPSGWTKKITYEKRKRTLKNSSNYLLIKCLIERILKCNRTD